jgi:hypothetical protein
LHGGVLDFIHLSATGGADIVKSTHLKGCPIHVFILCIYLKVRSFGVKHFLSLKHHFPSVRETGTQGTDNRMTKETTPFTERQTDVKESECREGERVVKEGERETGETTLS